MTSCSTVAEGFLNQVGESKKEEKQPLKQRCCQSHKNGKRMKGICNRNCLNIWNKWLRCLCSIYLQVPRSHRVFDRQIGENMDYMITAKFCRVANAYKKNMSIREQTVSSSTADMSVASCPDLALCWHRLPAEMQLGSNTHVSVLLVLVSGVVLP